jgi:hypothetical protein
MNIAGPLAIGVFIVTTVTVLSALFSYLIFKARERKKKKVVRPTGGISLQYFVEFKLPGMAEADAARAAASAPPVDKVAHFVGAAIVIGVLVLVVAGTFGLYLWIRGGTAIGIGSGSGSGSGSSVAAGTGTGSGTGSGTAAAAKLDPPPFFTPIRSRKPSLFPSASLDLNHDGQIQPAERKLLHQKVPQFVVVTSDDNGSVGGLEWMKAELGRRKIWPNITFFMTGNYLSGRKNYLGGPIDRWWQMVLEDAQLGLHGTTHTEGAEAWTVDRWVEEHSTVQDEIVRRLKLPAGWDWSRYPWGVRAPFLLLTDAYFVALDKLKYKVLYDASLVVHPGGMIMTAPPQDEVRDLPWPFTLDNPLPKEVDPPFLPATKGRATILQHRIWEMPVYGWWMVPPKEPAQWQPSLDYNLWKFFGCEGDRANPAIVKTVVDNLKRHYDGNRAPFHIGFHANAFDPKETCKRATTASLFDEIEKLTKERGQITFISIPHLLVWMEENAS